VLGLPCFGFVAGGLLAGAATLPAFTIMVIFLGLGVGMAAPYLLLAAKPSLLNKLPRTGPASELVKQVMGLLLLAAAAFFISAAIETLIDNKPYLTESISWWAVAFFAAIAGLWLAVRTIRIAKRPFPRIFFPVLGAAMAVGLVYYAHLRTESARRNYDIIQAAMAKNGGEDALIPGAWVHYSDARLKKALEGNHVVIADFTAKWCINCRAWKAQYLDPDPVRSRLQQLNAIMLEVNLSSDSAPGWAYLQKLGRTAVPTIAVYGPAVKEPLVFNAYTADTVMNALDAVTGKKTAAAKP